MTLIADEQFDAANRCRDPDGRFAGDVKYEGVEKSGKKWRAKRVSEDVNLKNGVFSTKQIAAIASDAILRKHFENDVPEHFQLNFNNRKDEWQRHTEI